MREFSLRNNIGEEYRLNSLDNFFHSPEGLGFQRDAVYQKIGVRYEMIRDGFRQQPISGEIMFKTDAQASAYNRYLKFKNFLQEIPLVLVYRIPGGEFAMDVIPNMVEKSEINSSLGMNVGIEFMPLSPWYKTIEKEADSYSVSVISDSVNESPCSLRFSGVTKSNANLTWSQTVDGVTVMTGTLLGVTIASTDMVYVRSDLDPYAIYKIPSGGTSTSLYNKSDFSTKRFPYLYKGENVFTVTGATYIKVRGHILYETV